MTEPKPVDATGGPTLQTAADARAIRRFDPTSNQLRARLEAQIVDEEPEDREGSLNASLDFFAANPDRTAPLSDAGRDGIRALEGIRATGGSIDPATNNEAARAWQEVVRAGYAATAPGGAIASDEAMRARFDSIETNVLNGLAERPKEAPYTSEAVTAFEADRDKAWIDEAVSRFENDRGLQSAFGSLPGYLSWLNRPWDPGTGAGNLAEKFPMFGDKPVEALNAYYGVDDPALRDGVVDYVVDPSRVPANLLPFPNVRPELSTTLPPSTTAPGNVFALPDGASAFDADTSARIQDVIGRFAELDPEGWSTLQDLTSAHGPIQFVDVTAEGGETGATWTHDSRLVLTLNLDQMDAFRMMQSDGAFGPASFGSVVFHELTHFVLDGKMGFSTPEQIANAYASDDARLAAEQLTTDRTNAFYRGPLGEAARGPYLAVYDARTVPPELVQQFEQSAGQVDLADFAALQQMGFSEVVFSLGGGSSLSVATDFGFGDITGALLGL